MSFFPVLEYSYIELAGDNITKEGRLICIHTTSFIKLYTDGKYGNLRAKFNLNIFSGGNSCWIT